MGPVNNPRNFIAFFVKDDDFLGIVVAFVGFDGKAGIVGTVFCVFTDDVLVDMYDSLHII